VRKDAQDGKCCVSDASAESKGAQYDAPCRYLRRAAPAAHSLAPPAEKAVLTATEGRRVLDDAADDAAEARRAAAVLTTAPWPGAPMEKTKGATVAATAAALSAAAAAAAALSAAAAGEGGGSLECAGEAGDGDARRTRTAKPVAAASARAALDAALSRSAAGSVGGPQACGRVRKRRNVAGARRRDRVAAAGARRARAQREEARATVEARGRQRDVPPVAACGGREEHERERGKRGGCRRRERGGERGRGRARLRRRRGLRGVHCAA